MLVGRDLFLEQRALCPRFEQLEPSQTQLGRKRQRGGAVIGQRRFGAETLDIHGSVQPPPKVDLIGSPQPQAEALAIAPTRAPRFEIGLEVQLGAQSRSLARHQRACGAQLLPSREQIEIVSHCAIDQRVELWVGELSPPLRGHQPLARRRKGRRHGDDFGQRGCLVFCHRPPTRHQHSDSGDRRQQSIEEGGGREH